MESGQQTSVDTGAETLTDILPNEILLKIFRFLEHKDLICAELVCWRWKTVVETYFATEKRLTLTFLPKLDYSLSLNHMKRYGSSVQALRLKWDIPHLVYERCCAKLDCFEEIADRFPNLLTIQISNTKIANNDFKCLSTKCSQLRDVTLEYCEFTPQGLKIFLQALPGIKFLDFSTDVDPPMYPDEYPIEDLPPHLDATAVFTTCRNLHTLEMSGLLGTCSDTASFSRFCKECVTLRSIHLDYSELSNEMLAQIQHCSLLEELDLISCNVDDLTLIEISRGCPNLKAVTLLCLSLVSEESVKCFARCKNLRSFWTDEMLVTDETLVELSNCVNLRDVTLEFCSMVSDRGCAALLAHCPQLQLLDVDGCEGVSNATVDAAIEAVECRQNGLVLQLRVAGKDKCFEILLHLGIKYPIVDTSVTLQKYENCHPLISFSYKW